MANNPDWLILDANRGVALTFTSFLDIDVTDEGTVLSEIIEKGSFADYNKTDNPLDINLTLAFDGIPSEQEAILEQIKEMKQAVSVLTIVTPAKYYENMTLETFSYRREASSGAYLLVVEFHFVEVREVETQVTRISSGAAKNPSSVDDTNTGKANTSLIYDVTGAIRRGIDAVLGLGGGQ